MQRLTLKAARRSSTSETGGFRALVAMTNEYRQKIRESAEGKTLMASDEPFECETYGCAFNNGGICRYNKVYGEAPTVTEEDGCLSGVYAVEDEGTISDDDLFYSLFHYLYRDADNYKVSNEALLSGKASDEDIEAIQECLDGGEYFIPSQVGLEGHRFAEETEADHPWFEFEDIEPVPVSVGVRETVMSVKELVANFKKAAGHWEAL